MDPNSHFHVAPVAMHNNLLFYRLLTRKRLLARGGDANEKSIKSLECKKSCRFLRQASTGH
jgi:hypothetical protein